jgi:hypothetical protein
VPSPPSRARRRARASGEEDITAHVDFTALAGAAADTGLEVLGYATQAQFLVNCGITDVLGEANAENALHYAPLAAEAQKLLSPAEMGELFKVLAVGRGVKRRCAALPTVTDHTLFSDNFADALDPARVRIFLHGIAWPTEAAKRGNAGNRARTGRCSSASCRRPSHRRTPRAGLGGRTLTLRYCVQCHNLANPPMHHAAKWPASSTAWWCAWRAAATWAR